MKPDIIKLRGIVLMENALRLDVLEKAVKVEVTKKRKMKRGEACGNRTNHSN